MTAATTPTVADGDRRASTPADRLRALAPTVAPPLAIIALQLIVFPVPSGIFVRGIVIGGLTALVSLGMALIHRSNRILNFAQADLGGVPAVLVLMLMTAWGWSYWLAVPTGLVAALLVGGIVEAVIIRRFRHAPRLILTVATLGLSQILAACALLMPQLWTDERVLAPRIEAPFAVSFTVGGVVFNANDVIAMVVVPICIALLAWFLQRTQLGVAVRATATSSQRASLLGIPVHRVQTLVWAVAGLLAFVATFLRAGILGLPVGSALSFGILLRALAALLIGRMTNLTLIASSAVALGVLELGVQWNASSPLLIDPILAAVIGIALVVQRRKSGRVGDEDASGWQAADEVRPVPAVLRRETEVRLVRWVGGTVLLAAALVLPHLLSTDRSLKASAVIIYGILALSLVVLSGWAGQVSLGQVAFFAIGAVVGAKATIDHDADLLVSLMLAALAGGVAALLVGLPALRRGGLHLAVTTFAFALATTSYLLNDRFFDWVPSDRVSRNPLLGRLDWDSPTGVYYVTLAGFVLVVLALRGVRRSRAGRVLLAIRENERAAEAYGVSPTRAKLTAFALSGAIAAFAGGLFVHHQQSFGSGPYDPGQNFAVFTMAVIGGIGSIPGAVLGAVYLRGTQWFLPNEWQVVATGAGVLLVLLVLPTGLGGLLFQLRDGWLRSVVRRRGLHVPSLVGDDRIEVSAPPPPIAGPVEPDDEVSLAKPGDDDHEPPAPATEIPAEVKA
ncbi:ABC transporter permease [Iamia sp. SCSIO 61187]|uniref:branched-chain amino acid ABC transporter permease n=1 Tax=Iamia sp. SCSIO 61187 TaxID=2722752 RepID=UPI001C6278F5|nr:ABC transporter permease [Iamia sp. SCSIO 61187]QYG92742.1 ABC transporter permease [Iamia sp. SCSIO 61187]